MSHLHAYAHSRACISTLPYSLSAGRQKVSYRRKAYMLLVSVGPLSARRWDQKFWVSSMKLYLARTVCLMSEFSVLRYPTPLLGRAETPHGFPS